MPMGESESDFFSGMKNKKPRIVSGFRLYLVWIGMILTIVRIALRTSRTPLQALFLLKSLINERKSIHDNTGRNKVIKADSKYYWSINIPGWPSEKFNYFISNEFLRLYSPGLSALQTMIFSITNICPLNCIHCYESENLSDTNRLSLNELKTIMDKIQSNGIRHIQFSGGEPLCRLDDMIALMQHSGSSTDYWVSTSGFGLTPETAAEMKKNGMTGVIISLDHWDENQHNAFRNHDRSFFWVTEAVRNCHEAGMVVCLSLCPVREFVTEENLNRYYHLAWQLGAGFIRIMEPRKAGRFLGKDILLHDSQVETIVNFMKTRNHDPVYAEYPVILYGGYHQRKTGCYGSGNRYLFIDSNGNFHSCPFCRNGLGNILSVSLDQAIIKARLSGCHSFRQIRPEGSTFSK
jgi:MoaA/NifB/PqqE/SkfB family radical SAM enzyme